MSISHTKAGSATGPVSASATGSRQAAATGLKLRQTMNQRKPTFVVKESHYSPRIKSRWRYPRGRHSKVRQMHCGRPALPNPGYGAPALVRGLSSTGHTPILVYTVADIVAVQDGQAAVISGKVGTRKRLALLEAAKERNIKVLSSKDLEKEISSIRSEFDKRKESKKNRQTQKSKKEQEKLQKAAEKEKKGQEKENQEKSKELEQELGSAPKPEQHTEEAKQQERKDTEKQQKEMIDKTLFDRHAK